MAAASDGINNIVSRGAIFIGSKWFGANLIESQFIGQRRNALEIFGGNKKLIEYGSCVNYIVVAK
jgi:hypothetical protein